MASNTSIREHAGFDIELDLEAEPPREKFIMMMQNCMFARTWCRRRDDFEEPSQSAYDLSLAAYTIRVGWSDEEIMDLLISHRRTHGQDLERLDYYQRTITNTREEVANSNIEVDLLIDELNSAKYPQEPEFESDMVDQWSLKSSGDRTCQTTEII